ncbi:MAG: DUF6516 family protein [Halobacteriales archaeon]|nr:DUF6516 family protein [Halobacteriales archaeon]
MPRKVKHLSQDFQDGTFVEVVAYDVKPTDKYPEGYKYRFQYGTRDGTILRYDNSHGKHDRHFGDNREDIGFEGLEEHLELFFEEVEFLRRDGIITPHRRKPKMKTDKRETETETEKIEEETVLVLRSAPWEEFKETALREVREFERGERQPYHVRNFEDATEIQRILTPKRLELIRSIMENEPDSMSEVSEQLGRGLREIHDDLHLLEKYEVVELRKEGRAKKPVVPYDRIKIEVDLQ